ncbi:MAG: hypothetical protein GY943_11110 [Chloroflexi bacterium]|nr:hypothetical protein [Chloroflexota bacterium]
MNQKQTIIINTVLEEILAELDLSRETETELLDEIRIHLEDALETAVANGKDETAALLDVAERFGAREVGQALQEIHAPWESADAIIACIIPVVAALVLRWLAFAPDGSAIGWQAILVRPAFWVVAIVALLIPVLQFKQWQYALISWGIFWVITVIFVSMPTIQSW